jgi:murein DD-endopeptidase MepM/ murein hydrolase activator NlpD
MSDNKNNRGINGKGYYIALVLCAAAIGITSYMYYRNADQEEITLQEPIGEEVIVGTVGTEEIVAALATEPQVEAAVPPTTQTTEPTVKKGLQTTSPVAGEQIWGYSMEALSYNQTTRDWRVHNGVDIAAEEGTAVCAAADGQVYTTYEDDSMGYTVVIRHEGGYTTKYSSLSQDIPVKAGDMVTMGQTIGYVGASALVETALGSHVHFGVTHQDTPMDPAEFLAMN